MKISRFCMKSKILFVCFISIFCLDFAHIFVLIFCLDFGMSFFVSCIFSLIQFSVFFPIFDFLKIQTSDENIFEWICALGVNPFQRTSLSVKRISRGRVMTNSLI